MKKENHNPLFLELAERINATFKEHKITHMKAKGGPKSVWWFVRRKFKKSEWAIVDGLFEAKRLLPSDVSDKIAEIMKGTPMAGVIWTDKEISALRTMVRNKMSAQQIADDFAQKGFVVNKAMIIRKATSLQLSLTHARSSHHGTSSLSLSSKDAKAL